MNMTGAAARSHIFSTAPPEGSEKIFISPYVRIPVRWPVKVGFLDRSFTVVFMFDAICYIFTEEIQIPYQAIFLTPLFLNWKQYRARPCPDQQIYITPPHHNHRHLYHTHLLVKVSAMCSTQGRAMQASREGFPRYSGPVRFRTTHPIRNSLHTNGCPNLTTIHCRRGHRGHTGSRACAALGSER